MNLTLFGLGREQEAAIRDVFEARGWDYVHELSLPSWPNFDATLFTRNSFVQPVFAENDVTVDLDLAAEPVCQDDSSAVSRSSDRGTRSSAGVNARHSGQEHAASERDGGREECVLFLFAVCDQC